VRGLSKRAGLVAILVTLAALVGAPVASSAAAKSGAPAAKSGAPAAKNGGGDLVPPVYPASESLSAATASVQASLTSRLSQLHQLSMLVSKAKDLTNADQSALFSLIDSDASGLSLLEVAVSTAQSVAALNSDAAQMVLDYHVFALAAPVVKDVISADNSLYQSRWLMRQIPEIEATVSASGLRNESESQATELLAQLPNRLDDAQDVLAGVVSALLALTPSSVPASLPTLVDAASAARVAAADIRTADSIVADITVIVAGTAPTSHARR
jgi:hypothetical protein